MTAPDGGRRAAAQPVRRRAATVADTARPSDGERKADSGHDPARAGRRALVRSSGRNDLDLVGPALGRHGVDHGLPTGRSGLRTRWSRGLIAALGLSPTQVLGLIDFYHAAKQLSDAVKLRRWSATQRTRWLNRTRGLLKRARVDEVITALRELCRGRTAGKIRTHLNYFLKNRHRFAYTTMVGLGLPRGSGAVESAIRRVINLRIKGASIYWLPESVDAILLLRSFYKSGRWNCLQRMAMTPVGVSA